MIRENPPSKALTRVKQVKEKLPLLLFSVSLHQNGPDLNPLPPGLEDAGTAVCSSFFSSY